MSSFITWLIYINDCSNIDAHSMRVTLTRWLSCHRTKSISKFNKSESSSNLTSEWSSRFLTTQQHTVPFTLVHTGKYRTEDKLKIQTIHKLNTTQ